MTDADDFKRCLAPVLIHEGGKVDDPRDPGGRTNQGVIQRVYDGWRRNNNLPTRDVFLMKPDERDAIYRKQYWDKTHGDELPPGISYVVFDGAVNSGPAQSAKWLQRALGMPVVDGVIGEATISACWAADHKAVVHAYCQRRLAFLKALRTWKTFGRGWSSRVAQAEKIGIGMCENAAVPVAVAFIAGGNMKATLQDAIERPSRAIADATTGSGVATGGLAGVLQQAQEQLSPYAQVSAAISHIVMGLVVVGAVLGIGGFVWARYQKRKQCERADALDLPMPTAGSSVS